MRKVFMLGLVGSVAVCAVATDWPQWRGVERTGHSPDAIQLSWGEGGPKRLWKTDAIGKGFSSPVILGDMIYITASEDIGGEWRGILYALNAKDGSIAWKCDYGLEWKKNHEFARTAPTIAGDCLYLFSGMGRMVCVSLKEGKVVWGVDSLERFNGKNIMWGIAESPLVVDDKVICHPGGKDASVVALDVKTGETVWTSKGLSEGSTYCSPMFVPEVNQIVTHTAENIVGLDMATGKVLWKAPHKNSRAIHPNTPVILKADKQGYTLVVSSGYGYQTECYTVALKDGTWGAEKKWEQPEVDCHHHGILHFNGMIVAGGAKNSLAAMSPEDGKVLYRIEEAQTPSLVAASGRVIAYSEKDGSVFLLDLQKDKYEICGRFKVDYGDGPFWPHPVLANGVLYIRHGKELAAYDVK